MSMSTQIFTMLVVLVAALSAAETKGPSSISIELQGVPSPLILPAGAGSNRVLSAIVRGGEVGQVWLAISCDHDGIPLARATSNEWEINLDAPELAEFLAGQRDSHSFRVCAQTGEGQAAESVGVTYRLLPTSADLAFSWDRVTVTVKQRSTKEFGGGALRLTLDDITAGQVLLALTGPDEQSIIDTRSVSEGKPISFTMAGEEYVLVVDRLTNILIGDDFAEISIYAAAAWARSCIGALIDVVANSDCTFIRNDQELSGEQFALLLRAKLDYGAARPESINQFIDQVATESSTTGKPYEVRCPNGNTLPASRWLRQHRPEPRNAHARERLQAKARTPGDGQ